MEMTQLCRRAPVSGGEITSSISSYSIVAGVNTAGNASTVTRLVSSIFKDKGKMVCRPDNHTEAVGAGGGVLESPNGPWECFAEAANRNADGAVVEVMAQESRRSSLLKCVGTWTSLITGRATFRL